MIIVADYKTMQQRSRLILTLERIGYIYLQSLPVPGQVVIGDIVSANREKTFYFSAWGSFDVSDSTEYITVDYINNPNKLYTYAIQELPEQQHSYGPDNWLYHNGQLFKNISEKNNFYGPTRLAHPFEIEFGLLDRFKISPKGKKYYYSYEHDILIVEGKIIYNDYKLLQ